ncbi:prolyl 4-hydroxylase subunit alpha-1-like [Pecten maximus]|uniref:prolyl 4-hydroxylase subunit alpha-1-like n=1 Tax=Pecten maximus TaxID=6579 RepID=UPI001458796F|nr:prolyl 4-hydroxylase subunit alpha-1-like [Pecten maximus]
MVSREDMITPISLCVLSTLIHVTSSELFTSMDYIYSAIRDANQISLRLDDYIANEENRLAELKQYAEKLTQLQNDLLKDDDGWAGNPVSVYKFTKVYTDEWDETFAAYKQNSHQEALDEILKLKKTYMPGQEDMNGVTDGLARLIGTYKISASEIANGTIKGIHTGELTAHDCNSIAQDFHTREFTQLALDWYDVAIEKIQKEVSEMVPTSCQNETCLDWTENYVKMSITNIKISRDLAVELLQKQMRNFTIDLQALLEEQEDDKELQESMEAEIMAMHNDGSIQFYGKELIRNVHTKRSYEKLCRGAVESRVKDPSLVCSYVNNDNHPLLLIQPAKIEYLSWSPYIVIYHDIMSDSETTTLQNLTFNYLERSQGIPANPTSDDEGLEMDSRISRYYYVDDDNPMVKRLNTRIQAITTLKPVYPSAEVLQVGNYGMGGQYEPHYDWFGKQQVQILTEHKANRLATMLFYLSDVRAGGATVFPLIDVHIPVRKGAAAFWLNLDNDLEGVETTLHAGCPVLIGSKWIANKWIHTHNQNTQCFKSDSKEANITSKSTATTSVD